MLIVVCDNFYTFPDLAARLKQPTEGEILLIGTQRLNNLDLQSGNSIKEAIALLENAPRFAFYVVQAK